MPDGFRFSAERKQFLSSLLGRIKPRLDQPMIARFLSECENEIANCLILYPLGWNPGELDSKLLLEISQSAYELNSKLRQLQPATKFALAAHLLAYPDRGIDVRTAQDYFKDLDCLTGNMRDQAMHLKDGSFTPINVRFSEEMAACLARSYASSFNALPSLRHDGIYKQFIDEVATNDLPDGYSVKIGKHQLDMANRKAAVHLQCSE